MDKTPSKRANRQVRSPGTRQALLEEALRLIAEEGTEAASVLRVTKNLNMSNGIFYYYFKSKEHMLEEVGEMVVGNLVSEIQGAQRDDVAARIALGPIIILDYVDKHPELYQIILRVLEDPTGVHSSLSTGLREDLRSGGESGRFAIIDVDAAVLFCRAMVASAARVEHQGPRLEKLGRPCAIHALMLLGIAHDEATAIVDKELELWKATKFRHIAARIEKTQRVRKHPERRGK
jgi:AcrR family transcriptional regulator